MTHTNQKIKENSACYEIYIAKWTNHGTGNIATGYQITRNSQNVIYHTPMLSKDYDWNGNLLAAFYDTCEVALCSVWSKVTQDAKLYGEENVSVHFKLHCKHNDADIKSLKIVLEIIQRYTPKGFIHESDIKVARKRVVLNCGDMNLGQRTKQNFIEAMMMRLKTHTNISLVIDKVTQQDYENGCKQLEHFVETTYEEVFQQPCYRKKRATRKVKEIAKTMQEETV